MIYKYQKIVTEFTTYMVNTPWADENDDEVCGDCGITELCTLDGFTYLHVPGDLPPQPAEITLEEVELTEELKAQIKDASPHVRRIRELVVGKIREKYSADEEMKIVSLYFINPLDPRIKECSDYKESCRVWGRVEKAKIGLGD